MSICAAQIFGTTHRHTYNICAFIIKISMTLIYMYVCVHVYIERESFSQQPNLQHFFDFIEYLEFYVVSNILGINLSLIYVLLN